MITFSAAKNAAFSLSGPKASIVVFPEQEVSGQWSLLSHPEEQHREKVVSWPGEYDFDDTTVKAIGQEGGRQIAYSAQLENVRLAFIDEPILDWSDAEIQSLGDVDVLAIAAADPKKIASLVETIDPRIIILFGGREPAACASALGATTPETASTYKVKPGSLPTDTRQVVILK